MSAEVHAIVTITYRPEWTPDGFLVWRATSKGGRETAVRGLRPRTLEAAYEMIRTAQTSDIAAASRLGFRALRAGEGESEVHVFKG